MNRTKTTPKRAFTSPPRVKYEPPTLDEAIVAARGLTEDLEQQVEIAAGLMGLPPDEVRPRLLATPPERPAPRIIPTPSARTGVSRAVVVERKPSWTLRRERSA
jgi:hypothetical protein